MAHAGIRSALHCHFDCAIAFTVPVSALSPGHQAEFHCIVDGEPTPKVEWSKGKWMKLQDGGRNKVYFDENTKEHILCISDIKPKDAGTYTVTATNEHGSEQAPASLMVTDKMEEVVDWKSQLKHRSGQGIAGTSD